ncbi:MAG: sodium ion-translocating decarboxylase subunit beta [Lachnospiraceae bacterium]|nr:sodium ion-translocating decarboxylase subunit beta [Lachnospiraceae bacterium]
MQYIIDTLGNLVKATAFASLSWGNLLMIGVALFFLYLAIAKDYEPLLLVPISFGMLLVNLYPSIMAEPVDKVYTFYKDDVQIVSISDGIVEFYQGEGAVYDEAKITVSYRVGGQALEIPEDVDRNSQEEILKYVNEKYFMDTVTYEYFCDNESILRYDIHEGELSNFDVKDCTKTEQSNRAGGLLRYFFQLDEWAILPCLIFMGVGAMTDFGPLIANPRSFLLGAAAQLGIFAAYLFAILMGFGDKAAAAISIIGGADGPTSIFLAGKLGQTEYMGAIAVAAYSYMSLVPIIQPPIMKLFTTEEERKIKMEQLRPVSKLEKILFPVIVTIVVVALLPDTAPLIGCLMLGNLFRESGVVRQLQETASNAMMYIVVIMLGTSVGATTSAEAFLKLETLKIVALGLVAFAIGTTGGVLFGKLMCKLSGGKINPLIGSAGVSAVPMAARVSQKVGSEADPTNFLLMHAMGPNVAGVIGTAVAAGVFMAVFGV